jgi:hypothetical protein
MIEPDRGEKRCKGPAARRLPETVAPSTASPLVGPLACLRLSWEWRKYTCLDRGPAPPCAVAFSKAGAVDGQSDALTRRIVSGPANRRSSQHLSRRRVKNCGLSRSWRRDTEGPFFYGDPTVDQEGETDHGGDARERRTEEDSEADELT